jgi:hypothetical protein
MPFEARGWHAAPRVHQAFLWHGRWMATYSERAVRADPPRSDISRWKHGLLLLRMVTFAARRIKFVSWSLSLSIDLHEDLINKNQAYWNNKPLLRIVYNDLYRSAAQQLSNLPESKIVELGSGIGNIRDVIPNCLRTELFPLPWIDQVENAYKLSFENESISDLILTDVFHHLKYPGNALNEFQRVLCKGGHVILLEPAISGLGLIVYGLLHQEPIAVTKKIKWLAPEGWSPDQMDYYAAQGNATRIFVGENFTEQLKVWKNIKTIRLSAIAYAASGGYSKPQLYPTSMLPLLKQMEKVLDLFPILFATRLLVVLEK